MTLLLGSKINKIRKEKGFSLEKLAEKSKVPKATLWTLENCPTANPTLSTIEKIAVALDITSHYLISESELASEILESAFFKKFKKLSENDKDRIIQLVDMWVYEESPDYIK